VCKSFYPVLFSAVLLVGALSFASTAAAQEGMSEETTLLAADAEDNQVEAETDNVSVEREDGKVSAKTSDVSTSNETSSQQSSLTVQQDQADEGSGSQAESDDVNTDRTSSIPSGTRATGSNPDSPSSPPDLITINRSDCTVVQGASITVEDGDGTEARFVDGDNDVEIRADASRVRIEGPNDEFIGDNAVSTSDPGFDTDGDYRVVTDTGVTCRGDNNNGNNNNRNNNNNNNRNNNRNNRNNDRNNRIIRINRNNDGGAANRQYDGNKVIVETIPDKGKLAATGGLPLAGGALLALASVGLGLSILRSATRRDP
jgi:hypothetical protein